MIKSPDNQLITLVFTLSLAIMTTFSCAVSAANFFDEDEDVIWRSGLNRYFKYTEQDESKLGRNDHPVDLNERDISTALKALEFTEKSFLSSEKIRAVFSASQINLLSKQIVKGFKKARPNQDIIFVMEGGSRKLILLNEKNFVAGRVFYKDGRLNIIIGEYDKARNDAFEKTYDPSGRAAVPYSFNYGQRSSSSNTFQGELIIEPGIENKVIRNKLRKDWFVIDVKLAAETYLAKENKLKNPSAQRDPQFEIEAAKLARQRREMRAEMARMRKDMEAMNSSSGSNTDKTLEERMATLEQLRKENLITQDEYDNKRQEILNDI